MLVPVLVLVLVLKASVYRLCRARNPIPDDTSRCGNRCMEFPPVCEEIPGCEATRYMYDQDATCLCSGAWGPYNMEIVDDVIIPKDLKPGDYVLGFRAARPFL